MGHEVANGAQQPAGRPVGGMAVCEGVMMRGDTTWAVAVRAPEGNVVVLVDDLPRWAERFERAPLLRGIAALAESMVMGVKALMWSVAQTAEGRRRQAPMSVGRTVLLAVALVAGIFFVLPATVAKVLTAGQHALWFNAVESTLRLGLFLAYLAAIGRIPEVGRLFEYHGAEHMAVSTHEAGLELTTEAAAGRSTRHARCGTTFMLVVMVVALLSHVAFGAPAWPQLLASRVLVVPPVAGISYEVLRFAGAHLSWRSMRLLLAPGMALQALTTRRPSLEQLEVALVALRAVLPAPAGQERDPATRLRGLVAPLPLP